MTEAILEAGQNHCMNLFAGAHLALLTWLVLNLYDGYMYGQDRPKHASKEGDLLKDIKEVVA